MLLDIIIKSIVGGLIIGVVSTIAQKQPTIGAFIMGIPIVTFITLIIMYYSGVDFQTLKTFSFQTVYFVLISLLFFPVFVYLLPTYGFWIAMSIGTVLTGSLMFGLFRYL